MWVAEIYFSYSSVALSWRATLSLASFMSLSVTFEVSFLALARIDVCSLMAGLKVRSLLFSSAWSLRVWRYSCFCLRISPNLSWMGFCSALFPLRIAVDLATSGWNVQPSSSTEDVLIYRNLGLIGLRVQFLNRIKIYHILILGLLLGDTISVESFSDIPIVNGLLILVRRKGI